MAERIVDQIVREEFSDRRFKRCSTIGPIVGTDQPLSNEVSSRVRELWSRYGSEALTIDSLICDSPELAERIDSRVPFRWAEVVYSMRNEYVERVDDLVDRRLGAFLLAPGIDLRDKIERWILEHPALVPHGNCVAGSQT